MMAFSCKDGYLYVMNCFKPLDVYFRAREAKYKTQLSASRY